MEELKSIFGEGAITYEQFIDALEKADKKTINLANLAKGGYVGKEKFTAKETELATAQSTIRELQEAARKWDGVDVEKLKGDMAALQTKYDTDIEEVRISSALQMLAVGAKAHDPALVASLFDRSTIKRDGETLLGAKEQLDKMITERSYLFNKEGENTGAETRTNTGGAHVTNNTPDFSKMTDKEYYEYIAAKKK